MKTLITTILFVFLGMYIYATTNTANDKIYIGKSYKEVAKSQNYLGSGIAINRAIEKYGVDGFEKTILADNISNENLLNDLEKHFIQLHASYVTGIGYNLTKGGDGFKGNHTAEAKAKIAKNHKCRQVGFVHPLTGISPPNKGIGKSVTFDDKEFKSRQIAADYYGIPRTTFNRILKSGLSIRQYKENHMMNHDKRRAVLEIETGKIYQSTTEMSKQIGLCQPYVAEIARENKQYKGLTYKYL